MCVPNQPFHCAKFSVMMNAPRLPEADQPDPHGAESPCTLDRCSSLLCPCRHRRDEDHLSLDKCLGRPRTPDSEKSSMSWRLIGRQLRELADEFQYSRQPTTSSKVTRSVAAIGAAFNTLANSCIRLF